MNFQYATRFTSSLILVSVVISGCDNSTRVDPETSEDQTRSRSLQHWNTHTGPASLPVISGRQLESLIQQSNQPVLVEFGVDFACLRCDQMKPQIAELARRFEGRALVVRVDFNANRQTAMRYGATICPSYVVFDKTRPVRSRGFPTSADLLSLDLESVLKPKDPRF